MNKFILFFFSRVCVCMYVQTRNFAQQWDREKCVWMGYKIDLVIKRNDELKQSKCTVNSQRVRWKNHHSNIIPLRYLYECMRIVYMCLCKWKSHKYQWTKLKNTPKISILKLLFWLKQSSLFNEISSIRCWNA